MGRPASHEPHKPASPPLNRSSDLDVAYISFLKYKITSTTAHLDFHPKYQDHTVSKMASKSHSSSNLEPEAQQEEEGGQLKTSRKVDSPSPKILKKKKPAPNLEPEAQQEKEEEEQPKTPRKVDSRSPKILKKKRPAPVPEPEPEPATQPESPPKTPSTREKLLSELSDHLKRAEQAAALASACRELAQSTQDEEESAHALEEAQKQEKIAEKEMKIANRLQSGVWQGGAAGAGMGAGVGAGLGTVVGSVVGGVVAIPTTGLGLLGGVAAGAVHGPWVKMPGVGKKDGEGVKTEETIVEEGGQEGKE